MVSTVRPNASETPSKPIPTCGNAADSTALPQPPRTSQNVPNDSAAIRLERVIAPSDREGRDLTPSSPSVRAGHQPARVRERDRIARLAPAPRDIDGLLQRAPFEVIVR